MGLPCQSAVNSLAIKPCAAAQVNVVVMRGQNDDELLDFVELTREAPLNVRFIEYMPFDGNVWAEPKMVPYREMLGAVQAAYPQGLDRCQVGCSLPGLRWEFHHIVANRHLLKWKAMLLPVLPVHDWSGTQTSSAACVGLQWPKIQDSGGCYPLQDARGEVAKNFRVRGYRGTVSFVTSMTSAFCGDCNRLRLMADGNLKVCSLCMSCTTCEHEWQHKALTMSPPSSGCNPDAWAASGPDVAMLCC